MTSYDPELASILRLCAALKLELRQQAQEHVTKMLLEFHRTRAEQANEANRLHWESCSQG